MPRKNGRNGNGNGATAPAPALQPTEEQIAVRAYELFLARGCEHGGAEQDWLRAEHELRSAFQANFEAGKVG